MKDFNYYAPTEVVFGSESEEKVAMLVRKYGGSRVLVHYGGQSAIRSGLLDKICGLLADDGLFVEQLGGVVPNPRLSKVNEGIALCRRQGIDFILAVGGGSVIDSAKAIAYGTIYEGDVWDFYVGKAQAVSCLPVASVLTIPAAGSEMSEASVITNEDGDVKLGYSNDISRPKFAIMNPERTFTLPPYQTAAGVTDMMMHTMERYFSHDDDMTLTDPEGTALRGIEAMEMFYRSIGMPVNIHELIGREITDDEIREMVRKCSRDYTATTGSFKVLDAADMEAIYRLAR